MRIESCRRRGALAIGVAAVVLGLHVSAAAADSLDNFQCYKVKDLKAPKFEKNSVDAWNWWQFQPFPVS